jgi:mRNA interferase MazF
MTIRNEVNSWIVIDQMTTIDRNRIIKKMDRLSEPEINVVKAIIKETFVD